MANVRVVERGVGGGEGPGAPIKSGPDLPLRQAHQPPAKQLWGSFFPSADQLTLPPTPARGVDPGGRKQTRPLLT